MKPLHLLLIKTHAQSLSFPLRKNDASSMQLSVCLLVGEAIGLVVGELVGVEGEVIGVVEGELVGVVEGEAVGVGVCARVVQDPKVLLAEDPNSPPLDTTSPL